MKNNEPIALDQLLQKFAGEISYLGAAAHNEFYLEVEKAALLKISTYLVEDLKAPLAIMIGNDERSLNQNFCLYYYFALEAEQCFLVLKVTIKPDDLTFPAITPAVPSAHWYEREVQDMFGLAAVGHPDPRRLVLHHEWPEGTYPLRKDFELSKILEDEAPDYHFNKVNGDGTFYVPVGPIHAGIIEPGHFRFSVSGETILQLEARLFYTHRGLEKLAEGKSFEEALALAERTCGACAFSHSVSFTQALERIGSLPVPPRANYLRTILLELERLYNHLGDVGNICAGVGLALGTSHGSRLKEAIMSLNQDLTGHRFLRGINAVGGLKKDISNSLLGAANKSLALIAADFQELAAVLLEHDSFLDRLQGTGILPLTTVADLGVVGVAARASGCTKDWRQLYPYAAYNIIPFEVFTSPHGDVLARFKMRIKEAIFSFKLIGELISQLPAGPVFSQLAKFPEYKGALGWTESPRGNNLHWVMTGPENTIYRHRIRSASYCNWPAVPTAVQGNIIPDFPLINKSFELCYACLDR